jgi:hypothetical protein
MADNPAMPKLLHIALASAATVVFSAAHGATLRCELTYGGDTQRLEVQPAANPYGVPSIDVGGRFRFKAVVLGNHSQVEAIKLYTYVVEPRQPVLVQQATYHPPFPANTPLTGQQYVYAGPQERELQYHCHLLGDTP